MKQKILHLYPSMPEKPDAALYFWHQLPWAVPGFLTFLVGLFLFVAGIYAVWTKERKQFFFNFSITTLGFGVLGLILALRAVILDRDILLYANNYLYAVAMLLSPGSYLLIHDITAKKYKIIYWLGILAWLTVFFGMIGIVQNAAFTGQWLEYSFGHYPVSSVYLKPWGILATASYFLIGIPAFFFYYRDNSKYNKEKIKRDWPVILGLNLLIFFTTSNLPSFLGYPIFPGANFSFFPMLLLAYGVFRSDFLSLNDLLFKKNALFYMGNLLLTLSFTSIAVSVAWNLRPQYFTSLNWFPWILLPLISATIVFWLGIVVGGSNPGNKINQIGSFVLYTYGFLMIAVLAHSLGLQAIVAQRIEQLCYLIFGLAIAIQFRFAFLALNRPLPKYTFIIDLSSIAISAMALTPFLYKGYYSYYFGNISSSSYVVDFMGVIGGAVIFIIIRTWWKSRKRKRNPLADWMVFYVVTNAVLTILSIPATMGFEIFPFSNLIFIPTFLIAFAILKYGGGAIRSHALRINQRFSMILFLLIPLFLLIYFPAVNGTAPLPELFLQLALIGVPMMLLSYQLTFLLTRPISLQLDTIYENLSKAKDEAEKAKDEIEKLNEFTKKINETTNITDILEQISEYILKNFGFEGIWFLQVNQAANELQSMHYLDPLNQLTGDNKDYIIHFREKIEPNLGSLYRTIQKKKITYLNRIIDKYIDHNETDKKIKNAWGLKGFIHIPLIIQDEVIGLIALSKLTDALHLSKSEIKSISRFCNQIAGAVYSSNLLKGSEEAKKIAEQQKEETERARAEIEKLNTFSKNINATADLDKVLDQVFEYFHATFDIDSVILQLVNKDKSELYTYKTTSPQNATQEQIDFSRQMVLQLDKSSSPIYDTYVRKKPFYMPKIDERILRHSTEVMKQIWNVLDLHSYLLVPLVIQNETIAMLLFTSYEKEFSLSKSDIKSISRFCEQIAGAIYSTSLLKQIREERAKAEAAREEAIAERKKSDRLLLNILPAKVADELKSKGTVEPLLFESVTVIFTDFIGFTQIAADMLPDELIRELDAYFTQFDEIAKRNKLEKLKTIGDAYMCAGGLPEMNVTHPIDACLAALEFQAFMNQIRDIKKSINSSFWELRLGIHTGSIVAGVVGKNKFIYDIWGDTVNMASRMESTGAAGKINISGETYKNIKDFFECEYRGKIEIKGKGKADMYFLNRIKPEFSEDEKGMLPNRKFLSMYDKRSLGVP